jgi:hypothetical protein
MAESLSKRRIFVTSEWLVNGGSLQLAHEIWLADCVKPVAPDDFDLILGADNWATSSASPCDRLPWSEQGNYWGKGFGGANEISAMPTIIRAGTSPSRCACSAVFRNAWTTMMPA